jgi:hypothetical protein
MGTSTLRFGFTILDRKRITLGLDVARVKNNRNQLFRGREWKGAALLEIVEYYMRELTSQEALKCVETQKRKCREYRANCVAKNICPSNRQLSRIKQNVRDGWTRRQRSTTKSGKKYVADAGRLKEAVMVALARYRAHSSEPKECEFLNQENFIKQLSKWAHPTVDGGHLLRITGDQRTFGNDRPPVVLIRTTIEETLKIEDEYRYLFPELSNPELQIKELLASNQSTEKIHDIAHGHEMYSPEEEKNV